MRGRTPKTLVVAALVVVALASPVVAGVLPTWTFHAGEAAPVTPHLIVNVQASNLSFVSFVESSVLPMLRTGDTIDLTHDPSVPLLPSNLSQITTEAATFTQLGPPGLIVSAHSGYLPQVGALANASVEPITEIAATLEPDGVTPGLPYNFSGALAYLNDSSDLVHARGLLFVGYATGSFLPEGPEASFQWDYGELAAVSDLFWVEMQGYAYNNGNYGTGAFDAALGSLLAQLSSAGQPLSKLAVQIILGGPSTLGVPPPVAVPDIEYATSRGVTNVDLWTSKGYQGYLPTTIAALDRPSGGLAPPCCNVSVGHLSLPSVYGGIALAGGLVVGVGVGVARWTRHPPVTHLLLAVGAGLYLAAIL